MFLCCLFIFFGMYISEKIDFKKLPINTLFGLFSINSLVSLFPYIYMCLSKNYHDSTWFYILLSIFLGYLIIKLVNCKYEYSDNISIFGFVFLNTCVLLSHKFSLLFFIINSIYYILLGIYVKKSKSWIYVLAGCILGILFSFINSWIIGYVYGINLGFILYFILSIYSIVFRSNDRASYISLIIGVVVALLGGLL